MSRVLFALFALAVLATTVFAVKSEESTEEANFPTYNPPKESSNVIQLQQVGVSTVEALSSEIKMMDKEIDIHHGPRVDYLQKKLAEAMKRASPARRFSLQRVAIKLNSLMNDGALIKQHLGEMKLQLSNFKSNVKATLSGIDTAKDMQDAVHNPAVAAPDSQKQAFANAENKIAQIAKDAAADANAAMGVAIEAVEVMKGRFSDFNSKLDQVEKSL